MYGPRSLSRNVLFACAYFVAAFARWGAAADRLKLPAELVVRSGDRERVDALVALPLAGASEDRRAGGGESLRLFDTTGGRETPIPVQLDRAERRLWWVAAGTLPRNAERTYRLEAGRSPDGPEIAVVDSREAVEAQFAGHSLLRYNKAHVVPPANVNPRYGRSAHLHPVRTPSGAIVTDELPPDHLHQSGIFLAYTKTEFEGRSVDFWNLAGGQGRVRFQSLEGVTSGPVFGQLRARHEHVDLSAVADKSEVGSTTGGKVALDETWDVRLWNPAWKSGYWLLDIVSTVRCAGASPLKLPEYHYGGMALRGARNWTPEHVEVLTSEGQTRMKGNHTRPRWCDMSGVTSGGTAGITMMTHPTNFRFPEPLRIHPKMPYMVYTPSFLGDWQIEPGQPRTSRYRFIIHDGQLPAETAERLWLDYADPLMATEK